jgi:hypothetical protein
MSGWFAMKRGITSHPLFKGRPDRLAVWVWLMDNAAWKETVQDVNGRTVKVPRGSVCTSERRIAEEVGVGYQVVRTFLDRLKTDRMINAEVVNGRSLITLCNWDKYQSALKPSAPAANAGATQEQRTKETREQGYTLEPIGSNDAGASQPREVNVISSAVWTTGKQYLGSRGVANAGAMIGRWLKDHPPLALLAAIEAAQKSGTQDPIPYITEALKGVPHGKSSKSSDRLAAFIAGARGAS